MNILITGSNGFVSKHLIGRLQGHKLSLVDRSPSVHPADFSFHQLDINGSTDFSTALTGCETVIHCAARVHIMGDAVENPLEAYRDVNTAGTITLAEQAVKAGVKRFIFISSIKVNGESSREGSPFKASDPHAYEDDYGQSKSEAEIELQHLADATGIELVVIRPTLVYGAGVKANFASLMNLVNKGVPLPFKCISNNKRSLVSVTNLADLIVTCIDHPKAANQVFLVSDDKDVSTSEMVDYMAASLGKNKFQIPVPQKVFQIAGKVFGKSDVIDRLLGSLQVDITHTKQTLDWVPPQKIEDGFKEAASAIINSTEK